MNYKKIFILTIVFLVIIPPIVFSLSIIFPNNELSKQLKPAIEKVEKKFEDPIGNLAREYLVEGDGSYAIYIKNLKTNEEYKYNENKKFDSASLYKLWLMGVVFQKIKDGAIKEDDILSAPKYKLDDQLIFSTPTPLPSNVTPSPIPNDIENISFRTDEAINKMITISDNYAALLIASKSGNFEVTRFLDEYDFSDSNFKQPPQTTAKDIGRFYDLLYKGEIVDEDYSKKMIEILKLQSLNDRIPKYLPKDIFVAHKTGELLGSKHDAGIVYSKKGDYIIVVLSDTENEAEAAERIAEFSKAVYDYYSD